MARTTTIQNQPLLLLRRLCTKLHPSLTPRLPTRTANLPTQQTLAPLSPPHMLPVQYLTQSMLSRATLFTRISPSQPRHPHRTSRLSQTTTVPLRAMDILPSKNSQATMSTPVLCTAIKPAHAQVSTSSLNATPSGT